VSRHIKGVKFAGLSHPGLIGCAPSAELLAMWNKREAELIATNPNRLPPLAAPPNPQSALAGKLQGAAAERVAKEGARTVPHPGSFSPLVLRAAASVRVQSQWWSNVKLLRNLYPPRHSNSQFIAAPGCSVMLRIRRQSSQDCSAYNAPGCA
jgi:hypothetical protein